MIELKSADKHDNPQWYTLYHQHDDTVTASSSITSAASLEVLDRLSAVFHYSSRLVNVLTYYQHQIPLEHYITGFVL